MNQRSGRIKTMWTNIQHYTSLPHTVYPSSDNLVKMIEHFWKPISQSQGNILRYHKYIEKANIYV